MARLNVLKADIQPFASGHIIEQIELVKRLIAGGHAYEAGGNVYFDVASWPKYGKLSGRSVDEMLSGTRIESAADKRAPADFALWKRAEPGHIMQWPSPWGMGFPGWHLECSAMSMKYLGESFDIHGGGMENQFPHHEDEIAQAEAATGKPFVKYWLHNNMVTVGGQKMGKSLGNFITLRDAIGTRDQPGKWDPMVLRMFILQSHYRSPLDFSDEALQAAADGYGRLAKAVERLLLAMATAGPGDADPAVDSSVRKIRADFFEAMDDDFNTARAIGCLYALSRESYRSIDVDSTSKVHPVAQRAPKQPTSATLEIIRCAFQELSGEILGVSLLPTTAGKTALSASRVSEASSDKLVSYLSQMRNEARAAKNFAQADAIRKRLDEIGILLEDTPEDTKWRFK
jgi:cysteinyl-tRNA synthetase